MKRSKMRWLIPAVALALTGGAALAQTIAPPAPPGQPGATVFTPVQPGTPGFGNFNGFGNPGFGNPGLGAVNGFGTFNGFPTNGFGTFNGFPTNGFGTFNGFPTNGFGATTGFGPNGAPLTGFTGTGVNGFGINPLTGLPDPRVVTNPFGTPGLAGAPTGFVGTDAFGNPLFAANGLGTGGFFQPFAQNFGFYPGLTGGYYPGYYGGYPGYYGGSLNNTGIGPAYDPANLARGAVMGPMLGSQAAVAGAPSRNIRPVAPGTRTVIDDSPKTPEDFDRARRIRVEPGPAGTREAFRGNTDADLGTTFEGTGTAPTAAPAGPIQHAPATRDQVMLARRAEELMAKRPMREGIVTKMNSGTVDVRYECDGVSRTDSFRTDEVFFFQPTGAISTIATDRESIHVGDRVLVPCDEHKQPRQAVAGSRQESRNGNASGKSTGSGKSSAGSSRARPSRHHR